MLNFFAQKEQKSADPVIMDLSIHKNIDDKLNYFHHSKKIPHIIFHGSSGSGKRTIVNNFLNKIYNNDKQNLKTNVMMVNCAHGKGIKFIREELKFFAKKNIHSNNGIIFKTIVLLNADCLTIDAQSALRRCIELFSYNTRFFIVVENKQKLLNPILSRFCEIYVPEHIQNGNIVNLHTVAKNKYYQGDVNNNYINYITEQMAPIMQTKKTKHSDLIELVETWYDEGVSSIDLIQWIKSATSFNECEKANYCMCFDKIKSEFRNEKLLMFYLLDFIFLRSNKDIKNILPL
jgi:DNA polymerase III delta prime subunit